LTLGRPRLVSEPDRDTLMAAASLARVSRHPLSRALVEAAGPGGAASGAVERPGDGVEGLIDGALARLGKRTFVAPDAPEAADGAPELWSVVGDKAPIRFVFTDALRQDAADAVAALKARGLSVEMLSGDRPAAVEAAAKAAGIDSWRARVLPADKTARIQELRAEGRKPLMIGD